MSVVTRVGFDQLGYLHEKAIHGSRPHGIQHVKVQRLPLELLMPTRALAEAAFQTYVPLPFVHQVPGESRHLRLGRGVDLYHCYNRVYLGRRPWGVTFETHLPRFIVNPRTSWVYRRACERLAAPACRFIVAMSEMARRTFEATHPELAGAVVDKLSVIYPAQATFRSPDQVQTRWDTPPEPPLRCLFVGNAFFRKGGPPLLRAVERLHQQGAQIQLDVVSTLETGDYVTGAGDAELSWARDRLSRAPFTLRSNLPPDAVLARMDDADLLLLPTLDDSFGMVVVEALSRGTPVLTTDLRALPEINPAGTGLVVEMPRGVEHRDYWAGLELPAGSAQRRRLLAETQDLLEEGIHSTLQRVLSGEELLGPRAVAGHAFAADRFHPIRHATALRELYRAALSRQG